MNPHGRKFMIYDLAELADIEVDSISNFERYDTYAAERGRIRKKTISEKPEGLDNNLYFRTKKTGVREQLFLIY